MKGFWTIPVLAAYIYAITILGFAGFYLYFGIPIDYLEASLVANTVYVHMLLHAFWSAFALITPIGWLVIGATSLFILVGSYFYFFKANKAVSWLFITAALLFAWQSVEFGENIARSVTGFYVPAEGCISGVKDERYIIPAFYQGKAILVPIDLDNKMTGGFLIRDPAELDCKLKFEEIGRIVF